MNNADVDILNYSKIQTSIAERLVETRRKHGLTLTGAAQRSDIAKGTLSNLESGKGNPTLETIWAIANILQVPFSELLQGSTQEQKTKPMHDNGTEVHLIERHDNPQVIEAYKMSLNKGVKREAKPHPKGVREKITVLNGTLLTGTINKPVLLQAGDTITFSADKPHLYESISGCASVIVVIIYPEVRAIQTEIDNTMPWPLNHSQWDGLWAFLERVQLEASHGIKANRITFKNSNTITTKETDKISKWLSQHLSHNYPVTTWLNKSEPYSLITLPKIPSINTKNRIAPTHLHEAMKWCRFAEKATSPMSEQQIEQAKALSQGKNITLACIAAEALTQRGIATAPNGITTVKKEQKADVTHSEPVFEHRISVNEHAAFELVHPAYARQVATLAVMASTHSKQGLKNIIDVGTGPGLPLTMLLELCSEVQSVTAIEPSPTAYNHLLLQFSKEKRVRAVQQDFLQFNHKNKSLDAIISVSSSHHLDTAKFLQKSRELLSEGGLLLVADGMISPFSCRKSRQSNLLKHHLRYIADTLVINSAEQKLSYDETKLINIIQDTVPVALFEVINGNDDHAANMCRKLLNKINMLDLSAQISHPFIAFYRFHILELEALVAGLDYEIEQKTFPARFLQLAEFAGFELLEQQRIYATDGSSQLDAGTHAFTFKAC